MKRSYLVSAAAEDDLINIYLYGYKAWGELQADNYQIKLYDAFELLSEFENLGIKRLEIADGIYSHPCGSHVIFFMSLDNELIITRILGESQDFEMHFRD